MVFFPSMRQQLYQVRLLCFLEVWHRGDDAVEIEPWIYVMVAAGGQQRLDHTHVFGGLVVSAEEIVFASERYGADFILGKVVVDFQTTVLKNLHHVFPTGIGICDGLTGEGAFAVMDSFGLHPLLHLFHDRLRAFPSFGLSCLKVHWPCIAFMLDAIQFVYLAKEP